MTNHPGRLTARQLGELPIGAWVVRFAADGSIIQSVYKADCGGFSGWIDIAHNDLHSPLGERYIAHVCREPDTTAEIRTWETRADPATSK